MEPSFFEDDDAKEFVVAAEDRVTITWRDVTYRVPDRKKDPVTRLKQQKTIVDKACGIVAPGELLAIMGSSGSCASIFV